MRELDPRIQHLREKKFSKKTDCRVKPGNDNILARLLHPAGADVDTPPKLRASCYRWQRKKG
jgi:hypothetical protein